MGITKKYCKNIGNAIDGNRKNFVKIIEINSTKMKINRKCF